jgi:FtsZ-binding cell division protein ZapB
MLQETIKMLTFEAEEKDRENGGVRGRMMAEMERLVARNEQLAGENGCMKEEIEAMRMDLASLLCKEQELR